jgi:hypothetical protein
MLMGCQSTTRQPASIDPAAFKMAYCTTEEIETYDPTADTQATIRGVLIHNAKYRKVCGK